MQKNSSKPSYNRASSNFHRAKSQFAPRREPARSQTVISEVPRKESEEQLPQTGFKQRRFLLKMEKIRKLHQEKKQLKSMNTMQNLLEYDQNDLSDDGGQTNRALKHSITKQGSRRWSCLNRVGSIIPEEEYSRNCTMESQMQTQRMDTAVVHPSPTGTTLVTPCSSCPSTPHPEPSKLRQETGLKYEFDLDIETENEKEEALEQMQTANQELQLSSFVPNLEQILPSKSGISGKVQKLRDIPQFNKKCLILPDDPCAIKWNFLLIGVILISAVVSPVRAAFYQVDDWNWIVVESIIDFVFLVDIILSFCSAYYTRMDELIINRKEIAWGYTKTWLIWDLISIFPLWPIGNSQFNEIIKFVRIPRIYRLIKVAKQVRLTDNSTRFTRLLKLAKSRTQKQLARLGQAVGGRRSVQGERILTWGLVFLVLCHNLGCLWFLVGELVEEGWVERYDYGNSPKGEQYLAAVYFIVTTITTVGYGDITGSGGSAGEQGFCIVLMLIGVISYSMAISSFMSAISASNQRNKRLRWKLDVLAHMRAHYRLPFELYWRLRQALHYEHSTDMTDQQALLTELPAKLKIELSNLMYAQELAPIAYFQAKSPNFVASVAPLLKPLKVSKGEYVFLKGDSLDGIYFLKKGQAAYVQRRPRADLIFATCLPGSFFGDVDFTNSDASSESRRLFSVKALTDMDLFFLSKTDLYEIDVDHKKEIFELFTKSYNHRIKLDEMARKSGAWLKRQLSPQDQVPGDSFQFDEADNDNEEDTKSIPTNESIHSQSIPSPKRATSISRALTLHKPTSIGSVFKSSLEKMPLSKSNKKKRKKQRQYRQGTIVVDCIDSSEQESQSRSSSIQRSAIPEAPSQYQMESSSNPVSQDYSDPDFSDELESPKQRRMTVAT